MRDVLQKIKGTKLLVVGDLIIDKYVFCTAIGKSSEAPVLVIKRIGSEYFVGGAGIVAEHINALGGQSHLVTVLGNDDLGRKYKRELKNATCILDKTRPTTLKKRYIADGQKLLRLSILKEHYISLELENTLICTIENKYKSFKYQGIVISDFNYGVLTERVLEFIRRFADKNKLMLFGDTQSSSQIGDFKQFERYDLITPTEREARIALADEQSDRIKLAKTLKKKTKAKNVCLTMGKDGFLFLNNNYNKVFPAINNRPRDSMGAGDSLLAAMSLCLAAKIGYNKCCEFANIVASLAIDQEGNIPITKEMVLNAIPSK